MYNLKTISTVLLLAFCTTVLAQDSRDAVHGGLKIGLNNSNVYDEDGEQFVANGKLGIAFGGFVAIPIGKIVGFQPEIMFSQKGFDGSGQIAGNNYSFTRTSNFLDVPLQLQIKPSSKISILGGVVYSYLLSTKDVFSNSQITMTDEDQIRNGNIRKNIMGLTLGTDINLSPIVISGRLGWDMISNHGDGTSNSPRYKNQWAQVTVGFLF
jgi:hypothetical protein